VVIRRETDDGRKVATSRGSKQTLTVRRSKEGCSWYRSVVGKTREDHRR
jgi:hypothetical protein